MSDFRPVVDELVCKLDLSTDGDEVLIGSSRAILERRAVCPLASEYIRTGNIAGPTYGDLAVKHLAQIADALGLKPGAYSLIGLLERVRSNAEDAWKYRGLNK